MRKKQSTFNTSLSYQKLYKNLVQFHIIIYSHITAKDQSLLSRLGLEKCKETGVNNRERSHLEETKISEEIPFPWISSCIGFYFAPFYSRKDVNQIRTSSSFQVNPTYQHTQSYLPFVIIRTTTKKEITRVSTLKNSV